MVRKKSQKLVLPWFDKQFIGKDLTCQLWFWCLIIKNVYAFFLNKNAYKIDL